MKIKLSNLNYRDLSVKLKKKQETYGSYRALGVDFGTKVIGMAIYDSRVNISLPFGHIKSEVMKEKTLKPNLDNIPLARQVNQVSEVAIKEHCDVVVVGLPIGKDGTFSMFTNLVLAFVQHLEECLKEISVVTYDERFSSRLADRMLQDLTHLNRKKRNLLDNALSASIILNDFIHLINKNN